MRIYSVRLYYEYDNEKFLEDSYWYDKDDAISRAESIMKVAAESESYIFSGYDKLAIVAIPMEREFITFNELTFKFFSHVLIKHFIKLDGEDREVWNYSWSAVES